jgi:peptidoglycan hydrolase-like protein with peptidoglycan-binding domain
MKNHSLTALVLAIILCMTTFVTAPAETRYLTLRYGSSGEQVRAMQQALNDLGFDTKGVDGKFGRGTEYAVKQFQRSKGLVPDGLAGNQTLTALYDAAGNPGGSVPENSQQPTLAPAPTSNGSASGSLSTLRYGSKGDAVRAMQEALLKLGYAPGTADGKFGRGTEAAVKQFQRNNGLVADGLAGTKTLTLLYSQAGQGGATTPPPTEATPTPAPTDAAPTPIPATQEPTATPAPTQTPAGTTLSRTLRKGYKGEDVKLVQQLLTNLKYYAGSISGVYDNATIAAVRAFQANNGLTSDGLAGAKTYAVLQSGSARAADQLPPPSYKTLKLNSTGPDVTNLQNALKNLGYNASVTGTFTTETRSAVVQFQMRNNLTADGAAGATTQQVLYSGSAKDASAPLPALEEGAGIIDGPSASEVQLLHWYDTVKPSMKSGQNILVFDPATKRSWTLRLYALGRHADSEPLTLRDTQIMRLAFGGITTWNPKPVYVRLPDGRWTLAATHDTPHLSESILGNDFDGHLCVHFLRDMAECQQNDPDYGVTNQNVIRNYWKQLTGQTYVEIVR